jgi:hypothetical protein
MDNKFFNFIKPALNYIDSGEFFRKPFQWVYMLIAALNLLFPLYIMYRAINAGVFQHLPAKSIIGFILFWIILAAACWVGFQIWWDRRTKVLNTTSTEDHYVAIPVFTHFVQTLGEWLGSFIAIVGFSSGLLSLIFGEGGPMEMVPMPTGEGIQAMVMSPLVGFFIIVLAKFIAEFFKVFTSIEKNTKKVF